MSWPLLKLDALLQNIPFFSHSLPNARDVIASELEIVDRVSLLPMLQFISPQYQLQQAKTAL